MVLLHPQAQDAVHLRARRVTQKGPGDCAGASPFVLSLSPTDRFDRNGTGLGCGPGADCSSVGPYRRFACNPDPNTSRHAFTSFPWRCCNSRRKRIKLRCHPLREPAITFSGLSEAPLTGNRWGFFASQYAISSIWSTSYATRSTYRSRLPMQPCIRSAICVRVSFGRLLWRPSNSVT